MKEEVKNIDYRSPFLKGLIEEEPENDSLLREVVGDFLNDTKRRNNLHESELNIDIK